MGIEVWIDRITRLWEISDGNGGKVRSFRVYERDEFPESISQFPCAITYITRYVPEYSLGGPLKGHYTGRTEFHLTASVAKNKMPWLMLFLARIRNAAAGHMSLGGTVDHFLLAEEAIQGPVQLTYGNEEPHLGFVVNWTVKADEAGEVGYQPAI